MIRTYKAKDEACQFICEMYPDQGALISKIVGDVYEEPVETIRAHLDCLFQTLQDNKGGEGIDIDENGHDQIDRAVLSSVSVISKKVIL